MNNKESSACTDGTQRQFDTVCAILDRFERQPSRLISILQAVQDEYRYLPAEVITFVATALGLPPAKVYGVATFYSHFTLVPKGKYVIKVCDGTACHVKGASGLVDVLRERLNLDQKKITTPDLLFTVETVSCLGACGLSPVMLINEDVHGLVTPEKAIQLLDSIIEREREDAAA